MPDDLEPTDDEQQTDESPVIRDLRKQAAEAKTEKERADVAERQLTLHKAGLGELSEQRMKALTAAHEGDWEPEALKATATELGFVQSADGQTTEPKIPAAELEAHQRVAAAAGGQPAPAPADIDAAIAAAKTPEELKTVLRNANMLASEAD